MSDSCTGRHQGSLSPSAPVCSLVWSLLVIPVRLLTLVKTILPEAFLDAFYVHQRNVKNAEITGRGEGPLTPS